MSLSLRSPALAMRSHHLSDAKLPSDCVRVAFDLGSNNGKDTVALLSQGFCVLAVDANPAMVIEVHKRLLSISPVQRKRAVVINVGLGEVPDNSTFYLTRSTIHSSFDQRKALHHDPKATKLVVPTIRCEWLWSLVPTRPEYVKIDIEERHYVCVEALERLAPQRRPLYLSWENHDFAKGLPYPELDRQLLALTARLGYTHAKVLSNNWGGHRSVTGDGGEYRTLESRVDFRNDYSAAGKANRTWRTIDEVTSNLPSKRGSRARADWFDFVVKRSGIDSFRAER